MLNTHQHHRRSLITVVQYTLCVIYSYVTLGSKSSQNGGCWWLVVYLVWGYQQPLPWWRHQMETFAALLAIHAGNSPVIGEFPAQRPVTWSFDVFFNLHQNERLSKQSWGWWIEMPWRPLLRHSNDGISWTGNITTAPAKCSVVQIQFVQPQDTRSHSHPLQLMSAQPSAPRYNIIMTWLSHHNDIATSFWRNHAIIVSAGIGTGDHRKQVGHRCCSFWIRFTSQELYSLDRVAT